MILLRICILVALGMGVSDQPGQVGAGPAPAESTAVPVAGTPADLPAASILVERFMDAVGGREAILSHRSRTAHGVVSMPAQGVKGTFVLHAAVPHLYVMDVDIPGLGRTATGYDGETGWIIQPLTGPMVLEGGALEQLREEADFYELLYTSEKYPVMETVARTELDGTPCYRVRLVRPNGRESFEYFDAGTGLLLAREGDQESPMGTLHVFTRVTQYRTFGLLRYPARLEQELMGMRQVIEVRSMTFDEVDPDVFRLPPEIEALRGAARDEHEEDDGR